MSTDPAQTTQDLCECRKPGPVHIEIWTDLYYKCSRVRVCEKCGKEAR